MNFEKEYLKSNRLKALLVGDQELLEYIKWLAWTSIGNTFKSITVNPNKLITREISDSWIEYEAGISEETIYNPYNTGH